MAVKPILFSGPMVRALLDGRKTQTRRIIKPGKSSLFDGGWTDDYVLDPGNAAWRSRDIPVSVGDMLWVREACALLPRTAYRMSIGTGTIAQVEHPTDGYTAAVFREGFDRSGAPRWRPSIHMPRWASRLTLRVTDVRVQRLRDISEADAKAEGIDQEQVIIDTQCYGRAPVEITAQRFWNGTESNDFEGHESAGEAFEHLWEAINGAGSWAANPWCVAYSFEVLRGNVSQFEKEAA